jgi:hypothetical protein
MVSALTKTEERDLRTALARLKSVNRPAYYGFNERQALTIAISDIEQRLNPKPVWTLLATADKVAAPLEYLLKEIDREAAMQEAACLP